LDSDNQWFLITDVDATSVTIDPEGKTTPVGTGNSSIVVTLENAGVFGSPAGLRTQAASNLVTIPSNSLIDFTVMDEVFPLAGQILIIDSGPDAGRYIIEKVESSKSLRLNQLMTGTTDSVLGNDASTSRDATLAASGSKTNLTDSTDGGALGTQVGHFITIFESIRADVDGTYEISDIVTPGSVVELDVQVEQPTSFNDPFSSGSFSWVRTSSDDLVEQPFSIYRVVPTEAEVLEVAPKRVDVLGVRRGNVTGATTLDDGDSGFNFASTSVVEGDMLEVLAGPSAGLYFIESTSLNEITIRSAVSNTFPVTLSDVPYRVWGGLHGSVRMLRVGGRESFNGRLTTGDAAPYRLLRPGVTRLSSTELQDNFDGSLYYMDVQVESDGAGNDFNLERESRLVVTSGLTAEGYVYSVENNRLTFSTFEEVSLVFSRRFLPVGNSDSPENLTEISGRNLKITYESSTTTRLVNDLMRSDTDRPINASPIARHFLPSFVFTTMTYSGGVQALESGQSVEDYVNSLGALDILEVSDLEAILTRRGATSVRHPIELVTVTHDLDRDLVVNRSDDRLGGTESVPFNGTGRISAFFTELGETLIVERES
jgi:hypothetical protein